MNPRGGYALHGTLKGWAALDTMTPTQRRALRAAFAGCNPLTFGRYGQRQLTALWPRTRVVVKDPFAMLSISAISDATAAQPVLVYRHPGAMLVSYRRMGWEPDLDELRPLLQAHRRVHGTEGSTMPDLPHPGEADPATAMGCFWSALYEMALDNAAAAPDTVVVAHEEIAGGGAAAVERLFERLGLKPTERSLAHVHPSSVTPTRSWRTRGSRPVLHNFDRVPSQVAHAWRAKLDSAEIDRLDEIAEPMQSRLQQVRLSLT